MDLKLLENTLTEKLPPVDKWNPELCGNIDIVIDRDGRWFHDGGEIKRQALVKLFCSVLKAEDNEIFLVTPVEKLKIQVEIEPFVIVDADFDDGIWVFLTKTGERVPLTEKHPMKLKKDKQGTLVPVVKIRNNLWAHFHRNIYYRMAEETNVTQKGSLTHWYLVSNKESWLFGMG